MVVTPTRTVISCSVSQVRAICLQQFESNKNFCDVLKARQLYLNFSKCETVNNREKVMYAYIRLVFLRNLRLSIVEDPIYREFSKFDERISRGTLKKVLLTLVELVEGKISQEMRQAKGMIMHDG